MRSHEATYDAKTLDEIRGMVKSVLENEQQSKKLLQAKGKDVQTWLDALQAVAELPNISATLRSSIMKAILEIFEKKGLSPRCLEIDNVKPLLGPLRIGHGFWDIWKGKIEERLVGLKVSAPWVRTNMQHLKKFTRGAIIWKQLQHPNILPFLGIYYLGKQHLWFVYPWVERDLVRYLKDQQGKQIDHYSLVYDVACGLSYLHGINIVHGDLKGINIFVTSLKRACIGSFEFSRLSTTRTLEPSSFAGSVRWVAPELFPFNSRSVPSPFSDIYAFGCVCYEVFAGRVPFHKLVQEGAVIVAVAIKKERPSRPESPFLNDKMWNIMEECWSFTPHLRPDASEIVARIARLADGKIKRAPGWNASGLAEVRKNAKYPHLDVAELHRLRISLDSPSLAHQGSGLRSDRLISPLAGTFSSPVLPPDHSAIPAVVDVVSEADTVAASMGTDAPVTESTCGSPRETDTALLDIAVDMTFPGPMLTSPSALESSEVGLKSSTPLSREDMNDLLRLVEDVLGDEQRLREILETKGEQAQLWLDVLQVVAEHPDAAMKLRSLVLNTMLRLSKRSGLCPQCLMIGNVQKLGDFSVGRGGFGDVWKGKIGDQIVCLKVMRVYQDSDVQQLVKNYMQEAIVWQQLNHPNLLPFMGMYYLDKDRGELCLVSPWMEKGNLFEYLRAEKDVDHYSLVHDIASGLSYLHATKIVHGDLKALNILMTPDERACIGDFGLSRVAETYALGLSTSVVASPKGTMRYLSPELFSSDPPCTSSQHSDVYAFACVCHEIFTKQVPFYELNDCAVIFAVSVDKRHPSRPDGSPVLTDGMWKVMTDCWNSNPQLRPTASEVLERIGGLEDPEKAGQSGRTVVKATDSSGWGGLDIGEVRRNARYSVVDVGGIKALREKLGISVTVQS